MQSVFFLGGAWENNWEALVHTNSSDVRYLRNSTRRGARGVIATFSCGCRGNRFFFVVWIKELFAESVQVLAAGVTWKHHDNGQTNSWKCSRSDKQDLSATYCRNCKWGWSYHRSLESGWSWIAPPPILKKRHEWRAQQTLWLVSVTYEFVSPSICFLF